MSDPVLRFEDVALPGLDNGGLSFDVPPHTACVILGSEAVAVVRCR